MRRSRQKRKGVYRENNNAVIMGIGISIGVAIVVLYVSNPGMFGIITPVGVVELPRDPMPAATIHPLLVWIVVIVVALLVVAGIAAYRWYTTHDDDDDTEKRFE